MPTASRYQVAHSLSLFTVQDYFVRKSREVVKFNMDVVQLNSDYKISSIVKRVRLVSAVGSDLSQFDTHRTSIPPGIKGFGDRGELNRRQ